MTGHGFLASGATGRTWWLRAAPFSTPSIAFGPVSGCGSPIAYDADAYPHEIHFYAASLEYPQDYPPEFHVFVAERLNWLNIDDDLPRHDGTTGNG